MVTRGRKAPRALAALTIALGTTLVSGCATVKPYEKEFLLNPVMDDAAVAKTGAGLMTSAASGKERLATAGGASAGGTSCPTCGG
jgi:hypothetical protein